MTKTICWYCGSTMNWSAIDPVSGQYICSNSSCQACGPILSEDKPETQNPEDVIQDAFEVLKTTTTKRGIAVYRRVRDHLEKRNAAQ